jgi:hypothetical protein
LVFSIVSIKGFVSFLQKDFGPFLDRTEEGFGPFRSSKSKILSSDSLVITKVKEKSPSASAPKASFGVQTNFVPNFVLLERSHRIEKQKISFFHHVVRKQFRKRPSVHSFPEMQEKVFKSHSSSKLPLSPRSVT